MQETPISLSLSNSLKAYALLQVETGGFYGHKRLDGKGFV